MSSCGNGETRIPIRLMWLNVLTTSAFHLEETVDPHQRYDAVPDRKSLVTFRHGIDDRTVQPARGPLDVQHRRSDARPGQPQSGLMRLPDGLVPAFLVQH